MGAGPSGVFSGGNWEVYPLVESLVSEYVSGLGSYRDISGGWSLGSEDGADFGSFGDLSGGESLG